MSPLPICMIPKEVKVTVCKTLTNKLDISYSHISVILGKNTHETQTTDDGTVRTGLFVKNILIDKEYFIKF